MPPPSLLHLRTQFLLSHQLKYLSLLHHSHQTHRLASSSTATSPSPPLPSSTTTTATSPPLSSSSSSSSSPPSSLPTLPPLTHPLGQIRPPSPGTNTGIDTRTAQQRRDDLFNYDTHLARRRKLTAAISRPYFRDYSALDPTHKGKTFVAPPRLFKAGAARYFPNFRGYTLADRRRVDQDTCVVIEGRVTFVSMFSGMWAERQCASWRAALAGLGEGGEGALQMVEINVEPMRLRAGLLWMFSGSLKKGRESEAWGRYFVVRRGFEDEIRADLGVANAKVGYVYLVDREGKIRWAGSGECEEGEKEGLVSGVTRLLDARRAEPAKGEESSKVVDRAKKLSGRDRRESRTAIGNRVIPQTL